jgi:cytochrome P450
VDDEYRDRLHQLSMLMVTTDISPEQVKAAGREMTELLAQVVAARRLRPGDDLTSALIAAREQDGDRLSEQELIGNLLLMIIAGHDTTTNLIGNAVRALCEHRDQLELVRSGRAAWADVVEEALRWDCPVTYIPFRYPIRDLASGGTVIPAGSAILAGYAAAGRDQAAFGPAADQFDVTRTGETRHLSFGHGPHYCLGAPLARAEAVIALEQLFDRFPDLDLAVPDAELRQSASLVSNGVRELPVRLRKEAAGPVRAGGAL